MKFMFTKIALVQLKSHRAWSKKPKCGGSLASFGIIYVSQGIQVIYAAKKLQESRHEN